MTISEILSLKSCVLCLKHGKWICNQCSNHFTSHVPHCYKCRKISKGYLTHISCITPYTPLAICVGYLYGKQTKKYLKYIKFKSSWQIVKEIVQKFSNNVDEFFKINDIKSEDTILIPVPIHSARRRQRGFNQSEVIAGEISKITGIYTNRRILRKVRNSKAQTQIKRSNRNKNVHGAFKCDYNDEIEKYVRNIVVVDDVVTTGSTIEECTRAINTTYPKIKVYGLALFRSRNRKVSVDKLIPNSNRNEV